MELPIAKQTYLPPAVAMARAMLRAEATLARTTCEVTELEGFTAYTDAPRREVRMTNWAGDVACDGSPAELLDRIDAHFDAQGVRCWTLLSHDGAWSGAFLEAAAERGYSTRERWVYLLDRYVAPPEERMSQSLQVIPTRAAYGQARELMRVAAGQYQGAEVTDALAAALVDRLDEARLESFMGRLSGHAVGMLNVLALGQVGVIDQVFTHPYHRRGGVASRLMDHAMGFCRRALFEQVILEADRQSPASRMVERIGFKPITPLVRLVRS